MHGRLAVTTLGIDGMDVESVACDYTVRLQLTAGHIIVIESPFTFEVASQSTTLSPEDDSEGALHLLRPLAGQTVDSAIAGADGGLRVNFTSGAVLSVEPDPAYEAWSVAGPDGALVVSTPGGKLAVWSAKEGDDESPQKQNPS